MLGYLKKVARIDTCRGQESVRTVSQQPLPEVRLLCPSSGPSPITTARSNSIGSAKLYGSTSSLGKTFTDEIDQAFEEYESEEEISEISKRRIRKHFFPESILHLLPPGSPKSARSSSASSGFKSGHSRPPTSCSDLASNMTNSGKPSTCRNNRHHRRNKKNVKPRPIDDMLRLDKSNSVHSQPDRRSSSQSPRPTTPTTLCPTIASALWRPLWPPGWHPRSSSSGSSSQHPAFSVVGGDNNRDDSTVPEELTSCGLASATNKGQHLLHSTTNLSTSATGSLLKNKMSKSGTENNGNNKETHQDKKVTTLSNDIDKNDSILELEVFKKDDLEKIEDWLDEHPSFAHSYFVRKASRSLIDSWLLAHSSSMGTLGSLSANQAMTSNENSGANTPVRKISAHEFEATGGGFLRPMVSTTCDGTPTFLPIQDLEKKSNYIERENGAFSIESGSSLSVQPTSSSFGEYSMMGTTGYQSVGSHLLSSASNIVPRSGNDLGSINSNSTSSSVNTQQIISPPPVLQDSGARFRASFFNSMKSREELKAINDEKEIIFELVKDICNDLDVRSLCHKILKNVNILTNADRCSLFLVRGEKNEPNGRYLASHLFDVSGQSTMEQIAQKEEIIVPWGTGIVGYVAQSGVAVNIPDCYKDSRFTNIIDQKTGYTTRNMLCNPIFDFDGEVMGVAQVINKNGAPSFTENDESVFAKYLQFCGIGIRNAQLYERSQLENKRNQVLLDLARMVFEKQSSIENIIFRILVHVLSLLQCERAQILLLTEDINDADFYYYGRTYQDPCAYFNMTPSQARIATDAGLQSESVSSNASTTSESGQYPPYQPPPEMLATRGGMRSFSRVFDLEYCDLDGDGFEQNRQYRQTRQNSLGGRFPINIGVTGYVATTGETLNIPDAYADSRFDQRVDKGLSFKHRHILCMPIRNATRKIIGVAQLVNKLNGQPFNKNDENLFEAFAIFSGMGIENTQMFEKAVKAMAKQKVTLELLSYHASATEQEAAKFARMMIPSTTSLSLTSLRFNDFSLDEDQMIRGCIRMFIDLDLIERFQIDYKVLCRWILSVRKNYRPVLYHNWRHAFNVAQMMFAILVQNTNICLELGELETLALLVACICHDLDHRGTNNSFHAKTSSPLAQLYSTSTLEHHHFDQSLMILNSQGNQIFSNLSPEEYHRVVNVLEEAILATDLAVYFQKRDNFFDLINSDNYDWKNENHRALLRSMLMTCCDVAAITKPWGIQKRVAELVASEFYQQGDIEKAQLNIEPIDMMNREKEDELPKMQMSFIDTICLPVYQAFSKLCPQMSILLQGVYSNRDAWNLLSAQPYQLTSNSSTITNMEMQNSNTVQRNQTMARVSRREEEIMEG